MKSVSKKNGSRTCPLLSTYILLFLFRNRIHSYLNDNILSVFFQIRLSSRCCPVIFGCNNSILFALFFTSLLNFFTKAPVRFVRVELFVWDELMQFFRRWNEKGEEVGEKRCCNIWKNSQWMILLNWKIKKCVQKKKYYNVLQQPSALLEKIFYVLTQFLVWFFSNFSLKIWHTVQIDEL